ncbi:Major facilitator, sugar transporter-like [Dillenia turbinata]|uniref:Major facilitator, sugar transporter-like n=1 Tax=Dillenia turbinata TaxID=194707 RepID=A0AAN8VN03_9MAGN
MADSTPLLTTTQQNSPDESETPKFQYQHHYGTVENTIEQCIGDLSFAQFLQAVLVSIAWLFDAQQTFISIFVDAEPTWHCNTPDGSCNSSLTNICHLPNNSWSWDLPISTSTISEWNLECTGSLIVGLPASAFFIGCLLGGLLLSTLADSTLGRKKLLLLTCLLMSLAALATAFVTNVWMYSVLRFLSGFGRGAIGGCSLVLSSELVGKRWRGPVGIMGFVCFTLGFLSLPAMAYANRGSSWRNLYIWTSLPSIFYCIFIHLIVRESPRWLLVKGRKEEAISTLKSMATENENMKWSFSGLSLEQETWNNINFYSAIKVLLEKKWALGRLSMVMLTSFGIGMVYYGMPLGLGNLSFNLYLSVTFNAVSEFPSSLITFFVVEKIKRKSSLMVFGILSGICSVMSVVVGKQGWMRLQVGFELVSFFSACTAFNILLIYSLELFPTCVRNSAVSMVRQGVMLGGVFSPVVVGAGRKNNGFVSYGVFGLVISFSSLFVVCLPETKGKTLCDTMDEEEQKERKEIRSAIGCDNDTIAAGV